MNSAYRRFLLAGAGIFFGYQGIKWAGRQTINRIADAVIARGTGLPMAYPPGDE